jgi:hypothetical protein
MAVTHMSPKIQGWVEPHLSLAWALYSTIITLFIGLRYEVGGDWSTYLAQFESMQGKVLRLGILENDFAYALLNWIIANIGGEIYLVNLVCAGIFCWGLIAFCRVQAIPWLALLLAVPHLIIGVAMGYTRQGVAIGLAMLAITRLMNGSLLRFIMWIAIAALFHKTALFLILLAVFSGMKNRIATIALVLISSAILFTLLFKNYLGQMVEGYLGLGYSSSGAGIRVALNALLAALFLLFTRRFNLDPNMRGFWLFMAWSALLFVPLLMISPSSVAVDRIALYWIPLQLFIISSLPDVFGSSGRQNHVWVFIIILFSALVMSVWLFFADHSYAWLPYRSYLWRMFDDD